MKKIGLIGGISWVSTIDYYRYINAGVNERLGGLNFAECIIYSLNFGDVQARGWNNSYELLLNASISLKRSGADAIVLCANTAHQFTASITRETGVQIIDIVSVTADAINKAGFKKVGLLGTQFTMEMDFFKDGLRKKGIEPVVPGLQETRNYIQYIVKEELGRGIISENARKKFRSIINELIVAGAEGIILGCTEIPMLVSRQDVAVPVFDTTKIHAAAIVEFALG